MKFFCGIIFAGGLFVLLSTAFAQQAVTSLATDSNKSWQYYDSLAATSACNGDTISALENYKKALELNPSDEYIRKNYERLNYLFLKSSASFYDAAP